MPFKDLTLILNKEQKNNSVKFLSSIFALIKNWKSIKLMIMFISTSAIYATHGTIFVFIIFSITSSVISANSVTYYSNGQNINVI